MKSKPESRSPRRRIFAAGLLAAALASLAFAGGPGCTTDYWSCDLPTSAPRCTRTQPQIGPVTFRQLTCEDFDAECAGRTNGCNMMTMREGQAYLKDCNGTRGYCIVTGSLGSATPMYRRCDLVNGEYPPCGPGDAGDLPTFYPPDPVGTYQPL